MSEVIEFECAVKSVASTQTGKKVVLELPENTSFQAAQLMEAQRLGTYLTAKLTESKQNRPRHDK